MSTVVFAVPAGAVAVIEVAEFTVNDVAGVAPNFTALAPVKLVPVIPTEFVPPASPDVGLTAVTVGAATYVNWSAAPIADVPPGAETVTSTMPAEPAGAVAVICVGEFTVKVVAFVAPNFTAVDVHAGEVPWKLVPVITTDVPPAVGPAVGLTLVTIGAGA